MRIQKSLPERLVEADVREYRKLAAFLFTQAMETESPKDLAALTRQYRLTIQDVLTLDNNPRYYRTMLSNLRALKGKLKETMEDTGQKREVASLARQYSQTMADIRWLRQNTPVKKEASPVELALAAVAEVKAS